MKIIELPYFELIPEYLKYKKYTKKFNLCIYDSFKNYKVNGGRNHKANYLNLIKYKKDLKRFEINFTFTNPNFDFFKDEINDLIKDLKKINDFKIGFIVSNDKFAEILKNEFPQSKIIKSITSIPYPYDHLIEDYLKIYDYIVPRVETFFNSDKDNYKKYYNKFIGLYSFECSNCPIYNIHYSLISINKDKKFDKCIFKDPNKDKILNKLLKDKIIDQSKYQECLKYNYEDSRLRPTAILPAVKDLAGLKAGRNDFEDSLADVEDIFKLLNKV